jgi:hypothetical protein
MFLVFSGLGTVEEARVSLGSASRTGRGGVASGHAYAEDSMYNRCEGCVDFLDHEVSLNVCDGHGINGGTNTCDRCRGGSTGVAVKGGQLVLEEVEFCGRYR